MKFKQSNKVKKGGKQFKEKNETNRKQKIGEISLSIINSTKMFPEIMLGTLFLLPPFPNGAS